MTAKRVPVYNKSLAIKAYELAGDNTKQIVSLVNRGAYNITLQLPLFIRNIDINIIDNDLLIPDGYPVWFLCESVDDIGYCYHKSWKPVIEAGSGLPAEEAIALYDIDEVDIQQLNVAEVETSLQRPALIKGINTRDQFEKALVLKPDFMQGNVLYDEQCLGSDEKGTVNSVAVQLLNLFDDPDTSANEIERVMSADNLLSARVLGLAATAQQATASPVKSLRDAIARIGIHRLKELISMMVLNDIANSKEPHALVMQSLVNAKMAEVIAQQLEVCEAGVAYTTAILQMLCHMLNQDPASLFKDTALADEVKDALAGKRTELAKVLENIDFYQQQVNEERKVLNADMNDQIYFQAYSTAMVFADETLSLLLK